MAWGPPATAPPFPYKPGRTEQVRLAEGLRSPECNICEGKVVSTRDGLVLFYEVAVAGVGDHKNPAPVHEDDAVQFAFVSFDQLSAHYMGWPNDEGLNGHPLWGRGLTFYSVGIVANSAWVKGLEQGNSVHSRHVPGMFSSKTHYIFTFKENTFECIAQGFTTTLEWSSQDRASEAALKWARSGARAD